MSMRVSLEGSNPDDYMVSFARDGRVFRQRDDKTIGYVKKEGARWVFRRHATIRIFTGKNRTDAVQEWVDFFNRKKVSCANCNAILPVEQMTIVQGVYKCPAHKGKKFNGISL